VIIIKSVNSVVTKKYINKWVVIRHMAADRLMRYLKAERPYSVAALVHAVEELPLDGIVVDEDVRRRRLENMVLVADNAIGSTRTSYEHKEIQRGYINNALQADGSDGVLVAVLAEAYVSPRNSEFGVPDIVFLRFAPKDRIFVLETVEVNHASRCANDEDILCGINNKVLRYSALSLGLDGNDGHPEIEDRFVMVLDTVPDISINGKQRYVCRYKPLLSKRLDIMADFAEKAGLEPPHCERFGGTMIVDYVPGDFIEKVLLGKIGGECVHFERIRC
jgi:hypothetical protein